MALPSRALLANLDVYLAEGNVRRAVTMLANNTLSSNDSGEFREQRLNLLAGEDTVFRSIAGNSATIIRCTKPVRLTVPIAGNGSPVVIQITSLFVFTAELGDLTILNQSATVDSIVQILQI
jgi:hypothetical protein